MVVTDFFWTCPGCGAKNKGQLQGDYYPDDDPEYKPIDGTFLPSQASLNGTHVCSGCGLYQMLEPTETLVRFPIIFLKTGMEVK